VPRKDAPPDAVLSFPLQRRLHAIRSRDLIATPQPPNEPRVHCFARNFPFLSRVPPSFLRFASALAPISRKYGVSVIVRLMTRFPPSIFGLGTSCFRFFLFRSALSRMSDLLPVFFPPTLSSPYCVFCFLAIPDVEQLF